mgnify:CR=1 FL=1
MKKILLLIVLINIFTYANSKKILIINSYSRDFEWTENQLRGIENYFYGKENIDFFYEYLDNKNIDSEEYLEQYKKIFREKYKNQTLDLIVTTDDFALSFIRDNYSLLKKVPYVIASGVNHEFPIEENVTILYEKFDIEKYMRLLEKGCATEKERLEMLGKKRDKSLEEIHFMEKQISCLDYLQQKIRTQTE